MHDASHLPVCALRHEYITNRLAQDTVPYDGGGWPMLADWVNLWHRIQRAKTLHLVLVLLNIIGDSGMSGAQADGAVELAGEHIAAAAGELAVPHTAWCVRCCPTPQMPSAACVLRPQTPGLHAALLHGRPRLALSLRFQVLAGERLLLVQRQDAAVWDAGLTA